MRRKRVVISTQRTGGSRPAEEKSKGKGKVKHDRKLPRRSADEPILRAAANVARKKRSERERRIAAQQRKLRLRLLLVASVATGAVLLGVSVYRSDLTTIRSVEVTGNVRLTSDEIRSLAAIPADLTLFRMDGASIEERVESSPWVAQATVARAFPDEMRIRVAERVPVALLDIGGASFFLVDTDGYVLAEQPPEDSLEVVTIRDVEDIEPVPGIRSESEALLNALAVWRGLSDEMRALTRAISAPTVDKTALITTDDVEVFVGSSQDIARKDSVAQAILSEQAGSVAYINVRSVDRPTWRGLDSP